MSSFQTDGRARQQLRNTMQLARSLSALHYKLHGNITTFIALCSLYTNSLTIHSCMNNLSGETKNKLQQSKNALLQLMLHELHIGVLSFHDADGWTLATDEFHQPHAMQPWRDIQLVLKDLFCALKKYLAINSFFHEARLVLLEVHCFKKLENLWKWNG